MISWTNFYNEFQSILEVLEKRRKKHLRYFYIGAAIAAVLLIDSVFCAASILNYGFNIFGVEHLASTGDASIFVLYALVISGFLLLTPVFHYRGFNRKAFVRPHQYSLKDSAYSRLFSLFGDFQFAPRGGISLLDTKKSLLFPNYRFSLQEDLLTGRISDVSVKLCEANMANAEHGERVSIFKGLLIVFDISEVKVKLRSNFIGRTVVVYDQKKNLKGTTERFKSMQPFALPEKYEPVMEGYTTNPEEASSIITPDLLDVITFFSEQLINKMTQQVEHWDSKIAHAVAETSDYGAKKLDGYGGGRLPSEVEEQKDDAGLDITKADKVSLEANSLNNHFELEYFDDKFILTVPCKFDLFETNPLFEPALNDEDAKLVFALMQTLSFVAGHLDSVK